MQPNLKIADWGQQQQSDYFWLKGNQRNLLPVNLILHCQFKLSTCELGMVLPLPTSPVLHWLDCWSPGICWGPGIEKPVSHQSRFESWHKLKGKIRWTFPPLVWLFLAWPCVHGAFVSGHHNSCSATYMHYKFLIVLFNLFCIQCLSNLVSLNVELLAYLADLEFVWWTHMICGTKLKSSKLCLVLSWPFDLAGEEILV